MKIVKKKPEHNDRLSLTLYEIYEKRRKYPRAVIDIPMKLKLESGLEVGAQLYDLSPDGIQIRCDRETASLVCPKGKITKEYMKQSMVAVFGLPYRREQQAIRIGVVPIYLLFIANNLVAFGMQFNREDRETLKSIASYINYELAPNIEELEEILKEKIGKSMPEKSQESKEQCSLDKKGNKNRKKPDEVEKNIDLAILHKEVSEIRKYTEILQKVLGKLTRELEDIEAQLDQDK